MVTVGFLSDSIVEVCTGMAEQGVRITTAVATEGVTQGKHCI